MSADRNGGGWRPKRAASCYRTESSSSRLSPLARVLYGVTTATPKHDPSRLADPAGREERVEHCHERQQTNGGEGDVRGVHLFRSRVPPKRQ